ncbi:serpin family protein [Sporosarcina oncorhynchi]|uniref:Serpin family protein n=1 Tax=Sporosarcina oncorhynchi TaxID=3056444 RepID=A0ABZ0L5N2_9BACL|nr:serpin family protein [Sporosarcina sp. T2O-4]WOV87879.1 serpin family protein [Sporosarcina sp. T2O-4]
MKKKITATLAGAGLLMAVSGCGSGQDNGNLAIAEAVDFGTKDYERIIMPTNDLAYELLDKIEANDDGNVFFSPASLWMALAIVYNGADGETKTEMAEAMQAQGIDVADLNKANASLMTALNKDSDNIQLTIANSIWLNEEFNLQKDFAKRTEDYFNAQTHQITISSNEASKKINEWVKKATNAKIDKMVDDPLDSNLVALVLNAIYFKGDWTYPFDKKQTEKRTFHLEDGTEKIAPFMKLQRKFSYMAGDGFQAVKLPYADGEMSMTVVLPDENLGLEDFKRTLSTENWGLFLTAFNEREGTILLPKFKMEYETELNGALEALGMPSVFTESADFSHMVEGDANLFISTVKQKTYIDVNEEGTEAAAVTGVQVGVTSAPADGPFHMEMNRPFFLMITDEETGVVLFVGYVANPQ